MKSSWTIVLVVIVLLALNFQLGCQESQKVLQPHHTISVLPTDTPGIVVNKKPVIKVANPVLDLGVVLPSRKYNCEFEFKNIGNDELKITRIKRIYDSRMVIQQLKKRTYAPGESGTIKITYQTPMRGGKISKRLHILSNDKKNPEFALIIKATVEVQVTYKPRSMKLSLKDENAGIQPITIKSKDSRPFAIEGFTSTKDIITADFDSTVEATEFVLEPKVDMKRLKRNPKLEKYLTGNIKINVSHPAAGSISINYNYLPLFDISSPKIIIKDAQPQNRIVTPIWITSNYGDKVEIESISSLKNHKKVLSQQEEYVEFNYVLIDGSFSWTCKGDSIKLQVEVTVPPQTDKSKRYFRDELRIKIKDSRDDLVVRCNGWYPRKATKSK